jgi:hypothetical protein
LERPADNFHWIDLKFKGFRLVFIFNLNVVFTMHFLKMALSRVRVCPGFPPGAGFLEEQERKSAGLSRHLDLSLFCFYFISINKQFLYSFLFCFD